MTYRRKTQRGISSGEMMIRLRLLDNEKVIDMVSLKRCDECGEIEDKLDRFVTLSCNSEGYSPFQHDFCSIKCLRDFTKGWK